MRLVAAILACVGVLAVGSGAAAVEPATMTDAQRSDEPAATVRADLERLEQAWAQGGGTYGYPFWEKAGRRWQAGELPASMYREYVASYREMLSAGCTRVADVDVATTVGATVRATLRTACRARLDALQSQQRWLDLLSMPAPDSPSERALHTERRSKHEQAAAAALQESYRATRLAMDFAQRELDARSEERIDEGAFI